MAALKPARALRKGRRLLHRPGRVKMPLGWMAAFAANAASRSALGGWMERVVFSDARDALPFALHDFRTRRALLEQHAGLII